MSAVLLYEGERMNTTDNSEKETIHLQEHEASVTEDKSRPAGQILAEQSEQENRPILFIP
jgi:hypothetical protein